MSNNNPLLEVRKAYRLLYDYQARVLDLMKFIGLTYNLPFIKGHPKFSTRGQNKLSNWSWDWLYMYHYSFHYNNISNTKTPNIYMSIYLLNDSGFFDANFEDSTISRLDVEKFKSAESSVSKLIFVAAQDDWNWWNEINPNSKKFLQLTEGKAKESNMIWKSYDLESFFDEEKALVQLQDFSNYCIANNIELKVTAKKI